MKWRRGYAAAATLPVVSAIIAYHATVAVLWHVFARLLVWLDVVEGWRKNEGWTERLRSLWSATLPAPLRLMDQFWLSDSASNPCHIVGLIETEKCTSEWFRKISFESLVRDEPKMLCTIERILGRLCWVPVKVVSPQGIPQGPAHNSRWAKNRAFEFRFEDFYSFIDADFKKGELCTKLSEFMSQPIPRASPLWRMAIIQDTSPGGSTAFAFKVHHCIADGTSLAIAVSTRLLENHPDTGRSLTTSLPRELNFFEIVGAYAAGAASTLTQTIQILTEWCLQNPAALLRELCVPPPGPGMLAALRGLPTRFLETPLPMRGKRWLSEPIGLPASIVEELRVAVAERSGRKPPTFTDLCCAATGLAWWRMTGGPEESRNKGDSTPRRLQSVPPESPVTTAPQTPEPPEVDDHAEDTTFVDKENKVMMRKGKVEVEKTGKGGTLSAVFSPDVGRRMPIVLVASCRLKYPKRADNYIAPVFLDFGVKGSPNAQAIVDHIDATKATLDSMKRRNLHMVWGNLVRIAAATPESLLMPVINHIAKRASMLLSTVKGPPFEGVARGGYRVLRMGFWPPSFSTVGRSVSCLSYANEVSFGVSMDEASVDEMRRDGDVSAPGDFVRRFAVAIVDEIRRMHSLLVEA